jgi:hypothetical protein
MKYLNDEIVKNIILEPCPFCGSEAEITERYYSDEGYSISVGCPKCFCKIKKNLWLDFNESTIRYNLNIMVKKWNTRRNDLKEIKNDAN